ncbi:MAG: fumarylacetoacetate hydrolase family protein [Bifidobacteriaceae bacterium]|jgi:2-keto-4-pentenoate hydratase/2-oxohepta-3-ene-1,7-dioic acid hydratase in catechol pathway|nr:fumarylacetoacetate hydrolase family protein [Bifidobacteriaceae bacterium]
MRIARFTVDETPSYGVVQGEEGEEVIHAVGGDPFYSEVTPTGLTYPIDDVRLLAPVIPRSKVIGVAGNYRAPAEPNPQVIWFFKPNTSVAGPGDPIVLDREVGAPAYIEAELALVIGRIAKDVPLGDAHKVILGYTVANDVGYRFADPTHDPRGFFGKGRDTFTPLGPWIETSFDLLTDQSAAQSTGLAVRSWIDGQPCQDGLTRDMVLGIAELVATASSVTTLLPGDIILTGTPAGAAPAEPGQRVTCEVSGLGAITNPVVMR